MRAQKKWKKISYYKASHGFSNLYGDINSPQTLECTGASKQQNNTAPKAVNQMEGDFARV